MPKQPPTPPNGRELDVTAIYRESRAALMRFASKYFRRPQEVEDVVQEAFVRVIKAKHQQRGIREPRSYLFRIVHNLAVNELERNEDRLTEKIGELLPELDILQTPSMEEQFESYQRFETFCRAVRRLPKKNQRVYILRRVYGFTLKETAEYLGISTKTVEAHQAKAMVKCADYMAEKEPIMGKYGNPRSVHRKRNSRTGGHCDD